MTAPYRVNRRSFFKASLAAGAALMLPRSLGYAGRWSTPAWAAPVKYQGAGLRKFVQPLRGVFPLDPNGIPVAVPDGTVLWKGQKTQHYTIDIQQYQDQLHPDLGPTTLWGYHSRANLGGTPPQRHLGGIIVAQRGTPIQITFQNKLPNQHILPVDSTIMDMTGNKGERVNRVAVHLHGGYVPWLSDGGPMSWFDDVGGYGSSVVDKAGNNLYKVINPKLQPGQAEYYYPMTLSARLAWYHDHAADLTRLNAYSGVASALLIRDTYEGHLRNLGLPDYLENGGYEIPLVIQDKVFVGADIGKEDPAWKDLPVPQSAGSLWYPHEYDGAAGPSGKPPEVSCVPEMFGNVMLANGVAYPEAAVEARRYRFHILNACQARFLNLQLYVEDGSPNSITLNAAGQPTNDKGPDFLVIGTEGGMLTRPALVPSNKAFDERSMKGSLITAPAERWDLIVDFSGFVGKNLILYTDAPAPFPSGDESNDFIGAGPAGPNTRQIMRFKVVPAKGPDSKMLITPYTRLQSGMEPSLVGIWTTDPLPPPPAVKVRRLTLNEDFDEYGRLVQRLGTNVANGKTMDGKALFYGRPYMDKPTETPSMNSVEVWQIANLTGDTHPMHFHLVNVQILSRQPFDVDKYDGRPKFTGPARGPEPTELGWKDTVKMHPGEVTTVIMRFTVPTVPFNLPSSPNTSGHEFVWHCHILEHEEHDMMRPLVIH